MADSDTTGDSTTDTSTTDTTTTRTSATDTDTLGDAGKQAIDRMKAERDEARRLARKEQKDREDLAGRLKQIEDRDKTEAEKAAERLAAAESEVAKVPTKVTDALRTHLVALHEIPDEDAELFLTASDPDLLLKQVTRLLARAGEAESEAKAREAAARRNGNFVAREGHGLETTDADAAARIALGFG